MTKVDFTYDYEWDIDNEVDHSKPDTATIKYKSWKWNISLDEIELKDWENLLNVLVTEKGCTSISGGGNAYWSFDCACKPELKCNLHYSISGSGGNSQFDIKINPTIMKDAIIQIIKAYTNNGETCTGDDASRVNRINNLLASSIHNKL